MPFWWIIGAKRKRERDREAAAAASGDTKGNTDTKGVKGLVHEKHEKLQQRREHVHEKLRGPAHAGTKPPGTGDGGKGTSS
mmetsp:Transcript_7295/g.26871  ORF Transcript_7295/g.26871 Transcript_7295/m.26871 type:complete len:81 (-) Transcript_7295:49-291(-)